MLGLLGLLRNQKLTSRSQFFAMIDFQSQCLQFEQPCFGPKHASLKLASGVNFVIFANRVAVFWPERDPKSPASDCERQFLQKPISSNPSRSGVKSPTSSTLMAIQAARVPVCPDFFKTDFAPFLTRHFAAVNTKFHGVFQSADVYPWHRLLC